MVTPGPEACVFVLIWQSPQPAFEMMGLGNGRRSMKSPPLVLAALVACIIVLGFNYWIASSRSVDLQVSYLSCLCGCHGAFEAAGWWGPRGFLLLPPEVCAQWLVWAESCVLEALYGPTPSPGADLTPAVLLGGRRPPYDLGLLPGSPSMLFMWANDFFSQAFRAYSGKTVYTTRDAPSPTRCAPLGHTRY